MFRSSGTIRCIASGTSTVKCTKIQRIVEVHVCIKLWANLANCVLCSVGSLQLKSRVHVSYVYRFCDELISGFGVPISLLLQWYQTVLHVGDLMVPLSFFFLVMKLVSIILVNLFPPHKSPCVVGAVFISSANFH